MRTVRTCHFPWNFISFSVFFALLGPGVSLSPLTWKTRSHQGTSLASSRCIQDIEQQLAEAIIQRQQLRLQKAEILREGLIEAIQGFSHTEIADSKHHHQAPSFSLRLLGEHVTEPTVTIHAANVIGEDEEAVLAALPVDNEGDEDEPGTADTPSWDREVLIHNTFHYVPPEEEESFPETLSWQPHPPPITNSVVERLLEEEPTANAHPSHVSTSTDITSSVEEILVGGGVLALLLVFVVPPPPGFTLVEQAQDYCNLLLQKYCAYLQ